MAGDSPAEAEPAKGRQDGDVVDIRFVENNVHSRICGGFSLYERDRL